MIIIMSLITGAKIFKTIGAEQKPNRMARAAYQQKFIIDRRKYKAS